MHVGCVKVAPYMQFLEQYVTLMTISHTVLFRPTVVPLYTCYTPLPVVCCVVVDLPCAAVQLLLSYGTVC